MRTRPDPQAFLADIEPNETERRGRRRSCNCRATGLETRLASQKNSPEACSSARGLSIANMRRLGAVPSVSRQEKDLQDVWL